MLTSLTHSCFLIAIISLFRPALPKSVDTERVEAYYSLPESRIRREASNDAIHFPSESTPADKNVLDRSGSSSPPTTPSPCPDGLSFCESADDYPKDFIKEMLKKQPKLLLDHIYIENDDEDLFNKFDSDDPNESPLCVSVKRTVYPTKAQSKEGLFFVVNHDEYRQGVKVESCMSDGGQCQIPGSLSIGYTSRCVQRHIVRTLVVLNKNSSDVEGFVTKPFEFPSCCSCVVSLISNRFGNPLGRSGSSMNTTITATTPPKPKNTKS